MKEAEVTSRHTGAAELIGRVVERQKLQRGILTVEGGKRISSWINSEPRRFAMVLAEFGSLITKWNEVKTFNPELYACSAKLRSALNGGQALPRLLPDKPTLGDIRALYSVVRGTAFMMNKGQREDSRGGYKFHLQQPALADEALVIGTLFHAYEVQVGVQQPRLVEQIMRETGQQKNYILDPLVEMIVGMTPTNPIFEAVVGAKRFGRLDWVYNYPAFTSELQTRFVAKENWTR